MLKNQAFQLLRDGDYLRLWLTGAITATLRWLEVLGIGVYTLEVTGSPLNVALMLFARTLPGVFLGSITGNLASRYNRKTLLRAGLALLSVNAFVLAGLSITGGLSLWHIAIGAVLSGVVWTLEHPVRRTLLGDVAGLDRLKPAMSLDQVTFNLTRTTGPLLGGGIYLLLGLSGIYIVAAISFVCTLVLVSTVRISGQNTSAGRDSFWSNLTEGFRYVARRPVLRSVLIITLIENFFGFSYATMVPVIGRQTLALDAGGIGVLQSMEGVGATIAAIVLAAGTRAFSFGRMFSMGALLFMAGVLLFARSDTFLWACIGLLVAGPGLAAFGAMQSTILLQHSDPEQRVRVMGVLVMCIGAGPIGVITVGLLANMIGPVKALTAMTTVGILLLIFTFTNSRELLTRQV